MAGRNSGKDLKAYRSAQNTAMRARMGPAVGRPGPEWRSSGAGRWRDRHLASRITLVLNRPKP
jgi:hypothetical protein